MASISRTSVKNFDDLELWLKKARKIRFQETRAEIKSVEMSYLFQRFTDKKKNGTYYVRGKEHCEPFRARSIHDFVLLVKYYKPELTFKQILIELFKEYKRQRAARVLSRLILYCPDIRKHNFRYYTYVDHYSIHAYTYSKVKCDLLLLFPDIDEEEVEHFTDKVLRYVIAPKDE